MATRAPPNARIGTGLKPRKLKLSDMRNPKAPPSAAPKSSDAATRTVSPPRTTDAAGRGSARAAISASTRELPRTSRAREAVGVEQPCQLLETVDQARAGG